jgi:hypothetical protein
MPLTTTGGEHLDRVRRALEALPNINDVELEYTPDFEGQSFTFEEELPEIDNAIGFYPKPPHMRLEFKIDLPMRIQEEVSDWRFQGEALRTNTEHFAISIRYRYHAPVAFVVPIEPTEGHAPSDSVAVIRNFLARELAKVDHVRFDCLGPSPFHCDFFIRPGVNDAEPGHPLIYCEHKKRFAYDQIIYYYVVSHFDSVEDAQRAVFDRIDWYFDFFYHLEQFESWDMTRFEEIDRTVSRLARAQFCTSESLGVRGQSSPSSGSPDANAQVSLHRKRRRIVHPTVR